MSIKKSISNLRPEVFSRLSNDLRKSAYLMGVGIVGIVLPSDNISLLEGFLLFLFGLIMWIIGHICANYATIKAKNLKGDTK